MLSKYWTSAGKPLKSKRWLEKKYEEECLSTEKIGVLCGVSITIVVNWMDFYGIKRRTMPLKDWRYITVNGKRMHVSPSKYRKLISENPLYYSELGLEKYLLRLFGGRCFICGCKGKEISLRERRTSEITNSRHKKQGTSQWFSFRKREEGYIPLGSRIAWLRIVLESPKEFVMLCHSCVRSYWWCYHNLGMTWEEIEQKVKKFAPIKAELNLGRDI